MHARLGAQLADWNTLKGTQLAAFCKRALEAGVGDAASTPECGAAPKAALR